MAGVRATRLRVDCERHPVEGEESNSEENPRGGDESDAECASPGREIFPTGGTSMTSGGRTHQVATGGCVREAD